MPKSTPLKRRAAFVFGPPIVLGILGVVILIQAATAAPRMTMVLERIEARAQAGWVVPTPAFDEYLYPRFLTEHAGNELVVINKLRPINPIDFAPSNLRVLPSTDSLSNPKQLELAAPAARALEEMAAELFAQGQGQLVLNSAYRTFDHQAEVFEKKRKQYGVEEAKLRSALPGYSEHQTGLAADISVPSQGCAIMLCFGDTEAGKWIADNSWRFGYIIRYEKETQAITGYSYEPWHLRYVGVNVAKMYAENGMQTLEEFWGLSPAPNYLPEIAASTKD